MSDKAKLSGGRVNYYVVPIEHPQREDEGVLPYQAECEDIIEALEMSFDEANIFKAIWRSAAARRGNGKLGQKALYDAEKIVHYGGRILRRLKRETAHAADQT